MTLTVCLCGHVPNAHLSRICDHCPCDEYKPPCATCNIHPRLAGEHVCAECALRIGPWE